MILYAGLEDGRVLALSRELKLVAQIAIDERPVQALDANAAGVVAVTLSGKVKKLSPRLTLEGERDLAVPLVAVASTLVAGRRAIVAGAASAAIVGLDEATLEQIAHERFAPYTLTGLVAVSPQRLVLSTWQAQVRGASFDGLSPQVFSPFHMEAHPTALTLVGQTLLAPTSAGTLLVYTADQPDAPPRSERFSSGAVWLAAAAPEGEALVLTQDGTLWRYDVSHDVRTRWGSTLANASAMVACENRVFVSSEAGEIAAFDLAASGARMALINVRAKPLAMAIGASSATV